MKNLPGHSSVTGTSRNDFFPGCFLASGFLSGKNRRTPIGSYRFQKGPAGDRLENYRNCPETSDRNPAAKNQSKTARKRSEAAKTGGIRHGNRRNRPAFRGSGNWIDRPGLANAYRIHSTTHTHTPAQSSALFLFKHPVMFDRKPSCPWLFFTTIESPFE